MARRPVVPEKTWPALDLPALAVHGHRSRRAKIGKRRDDLRARELPFVHPCVREVDERHAVAREREVPRNASPAALDRAAGLVSTEDDAVDLDVEDAGVEAGAVVRDARLDCDVPALGVERDRPRLRDGVRRAIRRATGGVDRGLQPDRATGVGVVGLEEVALDVAAATGDVSGRRRGTRRSARFHLLAATAGS